MRSPGAGGARRRQVRTDRLLRRTGCAVTAVRVRGWRRAALDQRLPCVRAWDATLTVGRGLPLAHRRVRRTADRISERIFVTGANSGPSGSPIRLSPNADYEPVALGSGRCRPADMRGGLIGLIVTSEGHLRALRRRQLRQATPRDHEAPNGETTVGDRRYLLPHDLDGTVPAVPAEPAPDDIRGRSASVAPQATPHGLARN